MKNFTHNTLSHYRVKQDSSHFSLDDVGFTIGVISIFIGFFIIGALLHPEETGVWK